MSAPVALHPADKPRDRSVAARRAARSARFERERLIVDSLNRGVAVAEIAGRVGVTEKRMRALVKDILARRMPAAPEDFAALQVSRLNEALLVAYSAMSPANLKAVALVVRIVRELDRYHGFVPAGRRASSHDRNVEAPADEPPGLPASRPQTAPQTVEKARSAPGDGMAEGGAEAARLRLAEAGRQAIAPDASPAHSPQKAPQASEKARSAPGDGAPANLSRGAGGPPVAAAPQDKSPPDAPPVDGPQTAPQAPEKVQSAPAQRRAGEGAPNAPGARLPPGNEPFHPTGCGPRVRAILNGLTARRTPSGWRAWLSRPCPC